MSKAQSPKVFFIYLILYTIIGALAAWIPFMGFGVMLGGISVLITAAAMAVLRTIDFVKDGNQSIGIKKFLIAIAILFIVDCLFTIIAMDWV